MKQNEPSKKPAQKNKKDRLSIATPKAASLTEGKISLIDQADCMLQPTPSKELLALAQLLSATAPSLLQQLLKHINDQSSYYTKDSFLKTFAICPNTCKKWMRKGLPYTQLDNIFLFKKSDVDGFFNRFRKIAPVLISLVSGLLQNDEVMQVFS